MIFVSFYNHSYSDNCDGVFSQLSPDGYIHQKLISHLHSALMFDELGQLLSDILWLAASCVHWDPNSLLGQYKKYRLNVPLQVRAFNYYYY